VKTLLQCERGQLPGHNHLERDGPIQAHLSSAINHAHPTAGDFFEQFVIAEIADGPSLSLGFCALGRLHADGQSNQTGRARTRRAIAGKFRSTLRTCFYYWHVKVIQ
jgi:hypothetical protein